MNCERTSKKSAQRVCALIFAVLLLSMLSGCVVKDKTLIESIEQFNESNITLLLSPGSASSVTAVKRFPNAKHSYITSLPDAYLSIQNGNADAFVYDDLCMRSALSQGDMTDLTIMDDSLAQVDIVVGVNPEKDDLLTKVNDFIRQMKADGTLEDMEKRWIDEGSEIMPDIPKAENPTTTLNFGTSGLIRPMNYFGENNTLTGFDVELLKRLALYLNADYTLEAMSFDALTASLQSGRLDIVASQFNVTEERREVLLLSEPYITSETKIMVCKNRLADSKQLRSLDDLNGKRLGTVIASLYVPVLEERYTDSEIIQFAGYSDAVQAMRSDRLDAFVVAEPIAKMVVKNTEGLHILEGTVADERLGFIFPLSNTELRNEFDTVLLRLKEDGKLLELERKWIDGEGEETFDIPELTGNKKGVLQVASRYDNAPFTYMKEGKPVGYDVELLYLIASELGYELEFSYGDFATVISGVSSGKMDIGIGSIIYTKERTESIHFTEPTYSTHAVAFALDNTTKNTNFFTNLLASFDRTLIRENRWKIVVNGLIITLILSIFSILLGSILGFLYSFPLRSKNRIIRGVANVLSIILDRVPLLVVLMVLYYIIFAKTSLPATVIGIFGFTLTFANSVAGMLNTGIKAVDRGETEAATAMGYSKWQIFTKISFPQAANQMFGSYASSVVALIKETSIIGYITVQDLTKASDIIRGSTYEAFFPLFLTAAIYFILASVFVTLLSVLAKKLDPKHRKRHVKES